MKRATSYGGTYRNAAGQEITVNPKSGMGDVVAEVGNQVISAECKGGIINTRHSGQVSRLYKGLCETVGMLTATPSQGRQVAVVPFTESTLRLAERLAPRCAPPSPDTLSWEDRIYDDGYGGTFEEERPLELRLCGEAKTELAVWDQHRWAIVERAKKSVLFETPIAHFLIRAFLAEGVDEFLAHITTIEAALGLQADYQKSFRIAPDRHKGMRATDRMRGRLAGLLGDRRYSDQYETLFSVRSAFLHGRTMAAISTDERVLARSLARQVVEALILATQAGPIASREDFLDGLLDRGAPMI